MTQPIPLPAPYAGVDQFSPFFELAQPNCEMAFNWNVSQVGTELRKGDDVLVYHSSLTNEKIQMLFSTSVSGTEELFMLTVDLAGTENFIRNAITGALVYSPGPGLWDQSGAVNTFNGVTYIYTADSSGGGIRPSIAYNGTTWAVGAYGGPLLPYCGTTYKNRHYIGEGSSYYYSPLFAITGPMNSVSLAGLTAEKTNLSIIAPFTLADNVGSKSLLAFIMENGEVLFFSGAYPDSPDWQLEGTGRIGNPLNNEAKISYQGDILVLCETGIISLRNLFLKGEEEANVFSLDQRVEKAWRTQIENFSSSLDDDQYVRGAWDRLRNKIFIMFQVNHIDSDYGTYNGLFFVYDTLLKSWTFHNNSALAGDVDALLVGLTTFEGKVVYGAQVDSANGSKVTIYQKETNTDFADRNLVDNANVGYTFDLISAPVANGRAYVQRCAGMDFILSSDMYDRAEFSLISDFGRRVTAGQKVNVVGTGVEKPFVNMGIEGNFIQYRISGSTITGKTVGLKFYAANFWQENGARPRQMDPLELMQILQAGQGSQASPEDILTFQQNVAARNPWRIAAAPILGAKFDNRTWSPGASFATAAGQAFLGTALNGMAANREQEQMQLLAGALPSLYANPLQAQAPEGLDSGAFDSLRAPVLARQMSSRSKQLEELSKDLWSTKLQEVAAKGKRRGELEAEKEFLPTSLPTQPT